MDSLYYKTLELQRIAESYFQHTKGTFSSDTPQSMKCLMIARHQRELFASGYLGSVWCLAIIRRFIL